MVKNNLCFLGSASSASLPHFYPDLVFPLFSSFLSHSNWVLLEVLRSMKISALEGSLICWFRELSNPITPLTQVIRMLQTSLQLLLASHQPAPLHGTVLVSDTISSPAVFSPLPLDKHRCHIGNPYLGCVRFLTPSSLGDAVFMSLAEPS